MVREVDYKVRKVIAVARSAVIGLWIIFVNGLRDQLSVHIDESCLIVVPMELQVGEKKNTGEESSNAITRDRRDTVVSSNAQVLPGVDENISERNGDALVRGQVVKCLLKKLAGAKLAETPQDVACEGVGLICKCE